MQLADFLFRHTSTQSLIPDLVSNFQVGVAFKGGVEAAAHLVNAALALNPDDAVAIDTDVKGAFLHVHPDRVRAQKEDKTRTPFVSAHVRSAPASP
jgi:hypothetical protein